VNPLAVCTVKVQQSPSCETSQAKLVSQCYIYNGLPPDPVDLVFFSLS